MEDIIIEHTAMKHKKIPVKMVQDFAYGDIRITDEDMVHAISLELTYLRSLEPDRLLAGFLETAGTAPKAKRYGGWETTEIQGHTLGHYLTAVSQAYAYTKERDLYERMEYIMGELKICQRADGYLFAWDEEIFDRVEQKKPAWVPWYTMHKILSGLLSVYEFTENNTACDIAVKLGRWIDNRTGRWTEETRNIVLSVEYGGMNDCLYELYRITGDMSFVQAAGRFDEMTLFEPLHEGRDILNGRHANTTIPKLLGALKRYEVLGGQEVFFLETAEKFWDMVVGHHTYITGGNSEWEHFGKPDILDGERTACNCETCNTYNMLKLSKLLFEITGDKKYADYYANTSLNAILSSQNPENGMTMYFQPMATGYFKVYSTPYESFWCCTGSGMENFTKLSEGICYYGGRDLFITRYVSCFVNWKQQGLKLNMACNTKEDSLEVKIRIEKAGENQSRTGIHLYIPQWAGDSFHVFVNGRKYNPDHGTENTVVIKQVFCEGDEILASFPMELKAVCLPDNKNAVAFCYGPYVLSAGLGSIMMDTGYTGVQVLVPEKEILIRDYFVLEHSSLEELKKHPDKYLKKTKGAVEFTFENLGQSFVFTPHYKNYKERYGIYWLIYEKDSKSLTDLKQRDKRKQELKRLCTDLIPVGNDQYELAHKIRGEETDSGQAKGRCFRYCRENGWFSYEMDKKGKQVSLCMTVWTKDEGSQFEIYAGNLLLEKVEVKRGRDKFYLVELKLPPQIQGSDQKVTIKFQNKKGVCRIFDELYLKTADQKEREERL